MLENICAELVLTGLMSLNQNVVIHHDNNVFDSYPKNSTYIVPNDKDLLTKMDCNKVIYNKNISNKMNLFIKKIN